MLLEARNTFPAETPRLYLYTTEQSPDFPQTDYPAAVATWEATPKGQFATVHATTAPVAFLVKLDPETKTTKLRELGRKWAHGLKDQLATSLAIRNNLSNDKLAAFFHGILLATYRPGQYKKEREDHPLCGPEAELFLIDAAPGQLDALGSTYQRADTQLRCQTLVDAPANKKRPQDLAAWATDSGERFGYEVTVWDETRCAKENFNALLGVNRGSEDPARFVIMQYRGEQAPDKPDVLVGKGVTFDTGGVSIKGSTNLHLMKSDMGGAAAVFGTLETCARLKLSVHVVGLVPLTDNSVDATAIKPSDVLVGHSGISIEIIDTDAEGRLIMSDALSYGATTYDPATLIDVATLTGSAVRTFGYECAALMSQNEDLRNEIIAAGERSGERCWPLPMWDSYDNLQSDVADVKNYSGKPICGAIDAAKFLERFTHDHPRYAHLDIAGVALKASPYGKDRQATGFGIALLTEWLVSRQSA